MSKKMENSWRKEKDLTLTGKDGELKEKRERSHIDRKGVGEW